MGYATGATTTGGSSGITSLYSNFFTNSAYTKYWDNYVSPSSYTAYNKRILGDATGELGPFEYVKVPSNDSIYLSSWYNSYAYFNRISDNCWMRRGTLWNYGSNSSLFAFGSHTGSANKVITYRIVLAP